MGSIKGWLSPSKIAGPLDSLDQNPSFIDQDGLLHLKRYQLQYGYHLNLLPRSQVSQKFELRTAFRQTDLIHREEIETANHYSNL